MKLVYVILGLGLLAGVGYVSYNYGSNQGITPTPTNTTNTSNTATGLNNSTIDLNDFTGNTTIPTNNTTTNTTTIGTKSLAITSPKNGTVVVADNPFNVTGTVSSNAEKIVVTVYGTGSWDGLDSPSYERVVDTYTLTKFKLGDTTWRYGVGEKYGNIEVGGTSNHRFVIKAFYTDGTTKTAETKVTYTYETAEMGKPVIYLYPTTTQAVSVNVKPTSGISYSEPVISSVGWQVTASPDGTLVDRAGKVWPYLFWEGFATNFVTPKEGFVVAKNEVSKFFDLQLTQLGLNQKEIADFKEFWVPRMQTKPYYFVTFIPQNMFNSYAPLTVTPVPDTIIRVFFDYKGLDKPVIVPTQVLPATPSRTGFTVVEWGGRIYR